VLSLRLHLWDLCSPHWTWTGDRWTSGNSWLRPVPTPALNARLVCDHDGRVGLVVRERTSAKSAIKSVDHEPVTVADVGVVVARAHTSVGEYLTVELQPNRVRLSAGPFGTAPLYLARRGDVLHGSWHLPDLRTFIYTDELLDRAVARRLTRQARYSADTIFPGVQRLTERATATFTHSSLVVTYPQAAEHILQPRELRPGADVVDAFDNLLAEIVASTPAVSGPVGIELSGGADSANVALTLAARHNGAVTSFGLMVDGPIGDAQQRRRQDMISRFGLRDTTVRASDHPPFTSTGVRGLGVPHDPTSAYYREAFDALRDAVAASGTSVICTGLGGDELCARHPEEYTSGPAPVELPPWLGPTTCTALDDVDMNLAPVAAITLPTLMALGTHNPTYLAAGIWPVSPLAHPTLVRFGEQLPLEWRVGKRVLRERLRRAGLAADIADPPQPETFSELMQLGLRRYGLPLLKDMTRESLLVDLGYLDHGALTRAYDDAMSAARIPSILCDAISLEVGLRSLNQAECRS
jgi:asparagine synthase (glutamine-hydrolysing)